jgi:hypothetical protein
LGDLPDESTPPPSNLYLHGLLRRQHFGGSRAAILAQMEHFQFGQVGQYSFNANGSGHPSDTGAVRVFLRQLA